MKKLWMFSIIVIAAVLIGIGPASAQSPPPVVGSGDVDWNSYSWSIYTGTLSYGGEFCTAKYVEGDKYKDIEANGAFDEGIDPGIDGWNIECDWWNGEAWESARCEPAVAQTKYFLPPIDLHGHFRISVDVPSFNHDTFLPNDPIEYRIREQSVSGWIQSEPAADADGIYGQEIFGSPPSGRTRVVQKNGYYYVLQEGCGSGSCNLKFGNYENATKCGTKFNDTNDNGEWDGGEGIVPGVPIKLWTADESGNPIALVATDTTDETTGEYCFEDLLTPGQNYVVVEDLSELSPWIQTYPKEDTSGTVPVEGYGRGWLVNLQSGDEDTDNYFGNFYPVPCLEIQKDIATSEDGEEWSAWMAADTAETGPTVMPGDYVKFRLNITNCGNVDLTIDDPDDIVDTETGHAWNLPDLPFVVEKESTEFYYTDAIQVTEDDCGPQTDTVTVEAEYGEQELTDSNPANFFVECPQGCTYTPGYWKTHSILGKAPYDDTWVGIENQPFYVSGRTWVEEINVKGNGQNPYDHLAFHYIAAYLNTIKADDPASPPQEVVDAMEHAVYLFETYTPTEIAALKGSDPVRQDFVDTASILGQFNEGYIGPGHCDDATILLS